jgi:epoxyqueuosine reductase
MASVARYATRDHYADLKAALAQLGELLTGEGWRAKVVADDNALVDRAAAERAGIGFFGKNCNILLPERGSWFLLGSVLTDAPLEPGKPSGDGCGPCRRCLASCPTGALVSPGVLDAKRCLAWLLQAPGVFPFEHRSALGARIYGCDDCQEACPANRLPRASAAISAPPPTEASSSPNQVDVLEILEESAEVLLARYGRWYIPQRDPRYLQRNALIVLGNIADGRSRSVASTVSRYLSSTDEMLRAHALWAAVRMGRRDLLDGVDGIDEDPSPLVQQELRRLAEIEERPF